MISLRDYAVITMIMIIVVFMFQSINIMNTVDHDLIPYAIVRDHSLIRPIGVLN